MHAYWVAATSLLSRRSAVREYLHGAYWVLPTLGIVIGLGAGGLLSVIRLVPGSLIDRMMFQGTAGDARGVLIVVSATMITTTGLVFSLTVLSRSHMAMGCFMIGQVYQGEAAAFVLPSRLAFP